MSIKKQEIILEVLSGVFQVIKVVKGLGLKDRSPLIAQLNSV